MEPLTPNQQRMAKVTAAHLQHTAERAVDDPVRLEKAARIVRVALERGRLTLADLGAQPGSGQDGS